ncbi:MAG: SRPBCC domain-containing protein [Silicimonas sp.]|nr:SRPBCC domain-containing protein [Silicimonas sp.]
MTQGHVERLSLSRYAIHTEIVIDAAPQAVWAVLTDTASYPDWAAFMVEVTGEIRDGARLGLAFQTNPAKEKLVRIDHVISVSEGKEFFWAEKGPMGICDDHHFRVEPHGDGQSRFVQTDVIRKGMTLLLGGMLSKMYLAGYTAFNAALKAEVERRAAR